jgi:quercetin dioxygenase-like cupin family protein
MTPPPHIHRQIHEAIYVLEGQLELAFESDPVRGGPGLFQYVPPGTVHRLAVVGDEPVNILLVMSPGEVALQMVEEMSKVLAAGPPSEEAMADLLRRIDMQPVG